MLRVGRVAQADNEGEVGVRRVRHGRPLMGDLIAGLGVTNGWAGVIINGAVRDVAVLRTLDLGIKALGSNPRKSGTTGAGERNVPVSFGCITVRAGDVVSSNDDGIVVHPS